MALLLSYLERLIVMAKLITSYIALVKDTFFNPKVLIFFLFLHENIYCGYSLEAPYQGASNEYPQHMFSGRLTKALLMSTHNICFRGEIRKIFTIYPPLSRLH